MSNIPKPARLPKPKSTKGADPADTAEHAELLTLAWSNLDRIIARVFVPPVARIQADRQKAWDVYLRRLPKLIENARRHAAHRRADAVQGDPRGELEEGARLLDQAAARLSAFQKAPPPVCPPAALQPSYEGAELAFPLTVWKGRPSDLQETIVGFVDISCQVHLPAVGELCLFGAIPHVLEDGACPSNYGFPLLGDPSPSAAQHFPLRDLASLAEVELPTLHMSPDDYIFWVDIRPTEGPVGQMLRELKSLRSYAPKNVIILVLMNEVSPTTAAMLQQEHFLVMTKRSLLEAL